MTDEEREREFFCRDNKPCIPRQHNAITFTDEVEIPTKDGLYSFDDNQDIVNSLTISTEVVRTYKVGLRVPESLVREQNELIVEREVLHYLRKLYNDEFIENSYKDKIDNGKKYESAYNKFRHLTTYKDILDELHKNKEELRILHECSPALNCNNFISADLPEFKDMANPLPSEISLKDYQYLAGKSFKMICKHLNTIVQNSIDYIPSTRKQIIDKAFEIAQREGRITYNPNYLNRYFQKAIEFIIGSHTLFDITAFNQLADNFKAYFTLRDKVNNVLKLFNSPNASTNFSKTVSILLGYYSIPNHLRKFLAKAWDIDFQWVSNMIVGWRRKLDPLLPKHFQIEPLTDLFLELADYYKHFARNLEDLKVIGILQKNHVLHLLPNLTLDLAPLLPSEFIENYDYLRNNVEDLPIQLNHHLANHTQQIDEDLFLDSLKEILFDVEKNKLRFPPNSMPYRNNEGHINKLKIIEEKWVNLPEFKGILNNFIIGNRFTSSVSKLFQTSKPRRFFTAIRGPISLTLAKMYPNAIVQFKSVFNPDNCLTRPFQSKKRVKKHLPVNLIFNKHIVFRKDNPNSDYYLVYQYHSEKPNVTDIFRQSKPIWLGLPIYIPDQLKNGLIEGRRKRTFWFQLIPSKKIVECINRGAEVRLIRLNVPNGANYKIVADIVLASRDRSAFVHRGKFLEAWDRKNPNLQIPFHDILGVDFNRIGKYMVAVANPNEEINILPMMRQYKDAFDKLEKYRKWEIPNIQRKLDNNTEKNGHSLKPERNIRLRTQITLLHQKRGRVMKEMKRHALMIYLFVAYKSRAKHLSWDSISDISTKGTSGALARAITYLPKRNELFNLINEWAQDLVSQDYFPELEDIVPVSPYTSQVCGRCFKSTGKMSRTLSKGIPYDEFLCTVCGKHSNRHSNSAQVSAISLWNLIQDQIINNNNNSTHLL
jgi:hypothetical protein